MNRFAAIPGNVLATLVLARICPIAGSGNMRGQWIILIAALLAGISMLEVAWALRGYGPPARGQTKALALWGLTSPDPKARASNDRFPVGHLSP